MGKRKEIIDKYRREMQKLDDAVMRSRVHFFNRIKKQTVNHLIGIGMSEFDALILLEKLNDFVVKCHKCGSPLKCPSC
ncbi:MAG: hypothetical protein Q6356_004470 [Candidatus Wukongarchaeota archaeon]|jgi:hypothetical protein|nr:hypothetical protein [Candidatus Wukongarchaeota archaeon]